jgi:hypothetical protein
MAQFFALKSVKLIDEKLESKQIHLKFWHHLLLSKILVSASIFIAAFILSSSNAYATEANPQIAPNNQVFSSGPQTVTISDTDGSATIHFTTNGTTVTTSSPVYSAAFPVSVTSTIQALAVGSGGTSGITTSVVQIDPSTASIPRSGLLAWQKSDFGLTISGSSVTQWADATGQGMNLTTVPGDTSPTFKSNAVNGLPAVNFNGTTNGFMWPAGFSDLTAGCSIFINYHPIGRSLGYILSLAASGNAVHLRSLLFCFRANNMNEQRRFSTPFAMLSRLNDRIIAHLSLNSTMIASMSFSFD